MCAILGTCLIQAQDYFIWNNLEKQLEMDCLEEELKRERGQMCLLEQEIEIMLTQEKKKKS